MGRPETTCSGIHSWSHRQGRITQTVRGSHVDITVRLGLAASHFWSTAVFVIGICVLAFTMRIVDAFLTGRAQQILAHLVKAAN